MWPGATRRTEQARRGRRLREARMELRPKTKLPGVRRIRLADELHAAWNRSARPNT
jgi:hypothetical protein